MPEDINSIFEEFFNKLQEEDTDKVTEKKPEEVKLDFQKEVEDNLNKVSVKSNSADIFFLKNLYQEVKKFDQDLPNKFVGIQNVGGDTLKKISNKYSDEFLVKVSKNKDIIKNYILTKLNDIQTHIQKNDFDNSIKLYEEIVKLFNSFPKEFTLERIDFSLKIKQVNIDLNSKLKVYKENKIKEIKAKLNNDAVNLHSILKPGMGKEIEDKIFTLEMYMNSIPKLFTMEIINEKIYISKVLADAENFLKNEYKRDFSKRKEVIYSLINKYQQYYLEKDLEKCLTVYDEMIFEFEKIPDIYLNEKIEIYKQINKLYTSINNLIMNHSVMTFLKTYTSGKTLEEVEDYLDQVQITKQINKEMVMKLKEKLSKIKVEEAPQKIEFENKLNQLLNIKSELKTNETVKPKENTKPVKTDKISVKNINPKILEEINFYYRKLQDSLDKKELKIYYKKIIFYLNTTTFDKQTKQEIIQKINKLIQNKKLE